MLAYRHNTAFCIIPFVGAMVNPDGQFRFCCLADNSTSFLKDENGRTLNIVEDNLQDIFNSPDLLEIRRKMLSCEPVEACAGCYKNEQGSGYSPRIRENTQWQERLGKDKFLDILRRSIFSDGKLDDILYLDLRLGNLCNLKCRMCNPYSSSALAQEHFELLREGNEGLLPYSCVDKNENGATFQNRYDWTQSEDVWEKIINAIPRLQKLYLTGGEPTLIAGNIHFLEKCAVMGRTDIVPFFNTNCTNINERFLSAIRKFKAVHIMASVDAVGLLNDYIRPPSKWDKVRDNLEKLASLPNVELGFSPTIQAYNVFVVRRLVEYVAMLGLLSGKKIFLDFIFLSFPNYLDLRILPIGVRNRLRDETLAFIKEVKAWSVPVPSLTMLSLESLVRVLETDPSLEEDKLLREFFGYTAFLDKQRGQNLADHPELRDLMAFDPRASVVSPV
jgi:MoaA/NifB/PqqE/SkfB family radical SAM enzyme